MLIEAYISYALQFLSNFYKSTCNCNGIVLIQVFIVYDLNGPVVIALPSKSDAQSSSHTRILI